VCLRCFTALAIISQHRLLVSSPLQMAYCQQNSTLLSEFSLGCTSADNLSAYQDNVDSFQVSIPDGKILSWQAWPSCQTCSSSIHYCSPCTLPLSAHQYNAQCKVLGVWNTSVSVPTLYCQAPYGNGQGFSDLRMTVLLTFAVFPAA